MVSVTSGTPTSRRMATNNAFSKLCGSVTHTIILTETRVTSEIRETPGMDKSITRADTEVDRVIPKIRTLHNLVETTANSKVMRDNGFAISKILRYFVYRTNVPSQSCNEWTEVQPPPTLPRSSTTQQSQHVSHGALVCDAWRGPST